MLGHLRETQRVAPLRGERHTDQASGMRRHEVDHLGRNLFGRPDQITLVFATLVIRNDDELARANIGDCLFYRIERHICLMYFPSTSASTCTRSPCVSLPNVVCSRVNGTRETCTTPRLGSAFTVKLTPSNVIEPCSAVVSATSAGTRMSTRTLPFDAFFLDVAASTIPMPSTCPCTKCPPSRSPTRKARSRLTV